MQILSDMKFICFLEEKQRCKSHDDVSDPIRINNFDLTSTCTVFGVGSALQTAFFSYCCYCYYYLLPEVLRFVMFVRVCVCSLRCLLVLRVRVCSLTCRSRIS